MNILINMFLFYSRKFNKKWIINIVNIGIIRVYTIVIEYIVNPNIQVIYNNTLLIIV